MNLREATSLIVMVRAGCPGMEIVEGMPEMWQATLDDVRLVDAQQAVVALVRASPRWIAPADVRGEVRRIRDDRLDRTPMPTPPLGLDPAQGVVWRRDMLRRIADGEQARAALGASS